MSVAPAATHLIMEEEIEGMASLAESYGWEVTPDLDALTVTVRMTSSIDQEVYIVEARCDDYKEKPPYFEFIHPDTGDRGQRHCYPNDGGDYFHSMPCICVEWSRKAYKSENGPHGNWNMGNWMAARPGTLTLGDMFHMIQKIINQQGKYKGRS